MNSTESHESKSHKYCFAFNKGSSSDSNSKYLVTPTRFWSWFNEEDFESMNTEIVASGNFGQIKKVTLKNSEILQSRNQITIYSGQTVALKDPLGENHNFIEEQYSLSHEVSCTLILHPNIINYIAGVDLGGSSSSTKQRVGIIMELMDSNLRTAIKLDKRLQDLSVQFNIAKQIASGMNFLHSLKPHVLHRDLRTPNILINQQLECKIADFGISNNVVYEGFKSIAMYTSLIPPECLDDQNKFTTKGDIYFYAWILIEMIYGKQPENYDLKRNSDLISKNLKERNLETYSNLILKCLAYDPKQRPTFNQILTELNVLLNVKYDLELITQNNLEELLREGIESNAITPFTCDSLKRNIIHQCCIFGNLNLLKYLIQLWGDFYLNVTDKYNTSLTHLAARNGYLDILHFLHSKNAISNEPEYRFEVSGLDLAIEMNHTNCTDFLIIYANQNTLNSALLSASSEGKLEVVKKLVGRGADLQCRLKDTGAHPLDRACYSGHKDVVSFLLESGAPVNQTRPDGISSLYVACFHGEKEIVKILLSYGADPSQVLKDTGSSPLFNASQNGYSEIVELLLKHGADPNLNRTDSTSPLIIAAFTGHAEVVSILLQNGAKFDHKFNSKTAYSWAKNVKHTHVLKVFEKFFKQRNIKFSDQ